MTPYAAAGSQAVTKLVETDTDRIAGLAPEAWISVPDHCRFLLGEYGGILLLELAEDGKCGIRIEMRRERTPQGRRGPVACCG